MILGIGNDMIDIRRIEKTLERFGPRFTHRVFTDIERKRSERKTMSAASFAKRFAAKEACSKALGTGLRRGVFWRDMGVVNMKSGQPTLALTGGAAARLVEMLYSAERMLELATDPEITDPNVRPVVTNTPTEGVGSVEAPRGTLTHHYKTDEKGILTNVNLVVPVVAAVAVIVIAIVVICVLRGNNHPPPGFPKGTFNTIFSSL